MPLTAKGEEILSAMQKPPSEGGYGKEKGESVFYASKNAGTISGVDVHCSGVDAILAWGGGRRDFHPGGEGDTTDPGEAIHRASSIE